VREIVHQLRFRNLGGLIILDLIDMESAANREKVYRALQDALREDKSKVNILKISELGLVEMTRKRTRESLEQQLCDACSTCEGKGYLQSSQTIANRIFRDLPKAATYLHGATLRVQAHPNVAQILDGEAADAVMRVRERISREIVVEAVSTFHPEQYEIVSEGERVPLLAPPDEATLARFDTAPEPLPAAEELSAEELPDEDVKGDEVDGVDAGGEALSTDEPEPEPANEDDEAPLV
jgi:Ribonuclease G/E